MTNTNMCIGMMLININFVVVLIMFMKGADFSEFNHQFSLAKGCQQSKPYRE